MKLYPQKIVIYDSEYRFPSGNGGEAELVCLCAKMYSVSTSGLMLRGSLVYGLGYDEIPPEWFDPELVWIAFSNHTDGLLLRSLGIEAVHHVDAMNELRGVFNGSKAGEGLFSLLSYAEFLGLTEITEQAHKDAMRDVILDGRAEQFREEVLAYCAQDVELLAKIIAKVFKAIHWPSALWRGQVADEFAIIETRGLPVDGELLSRVKASWPYIRERLADKANAKLGLNLFRSSGNFETKIFIEYLKGRELFTAWPRTKGGSLSTSEETLKEWSKRDEGVSYLREVRSTLLSGAHGLRFTPHEGRVFAWLNAFGTKTGRCAPKSPLKAVAKDERSQGFLLAGATWVRSFLSPPKGKVLIALDWISQEAAIGAYLSSDEALWACYDSGDIYAHFAKLAGEMPKAGTKETHPEIRDKLKTLFLALSYGMGSRSLAKRMNVTDRVAAALHEIHKRIFWRYHAWSAGFKAKAFLERRATNPAHWPIWVTSDTRPTTIANWPVQSLGAVMLHQSLLLMRDAGLRVVATLHDAIFIESTEELAEAEEALAHLLMRQASADVMQSPYYCGVESKLIRYGERYTDKRGDALFSQIVELLDEPLTLSA